jgi:hypothetical protein
MNRYGKFLHSREEGELAYKKIRDLLEKTSDNFIFDFEGVLVLAPSYCDEVFGKLQVNFPNRIKIKNNTSHGLKVAFETVEETGGLNFDWV